MLVALLVAVAAHHLLRSESTDRSDSHGSDTLQVADDTTAVTDTTTTKGAEHVGSEGPLGSCVVAPPIRVVTSVPRRRHAGTTAGEGDAGWYGEETTLREDGVRAEDGGRREEDTGADEENFGEEDVRAFVSAVAARREPVLIRSPSFRRWLARRGWWRAGEWTMASLRAAGAAKGITVDVEEGTERFFYYYDKGNSELMEGDLANEREELGEGAAERGVEGGRDAVRAQRGERGTGERGTTQRGAERGGGGKRESGGVGGRKRRTLHNIPLTELVDIVSGASAAGDASGEGTYVY